MNFLQDVRAYASEHYNDGWDFVVECWDDEYLIEIIGDSENLETALARCREILDVQNDRRKDIQAEIF